MNSRIKAAFRGAQLVKGQFKDSGCLLTISIGQESHEGERFEAIVDLINESFAFCVMSMHDGLQRYTMALNKKESPNDFLAVSIEEGELWLKRNAAAYSRLKGLKIIRWRDWLAHPEYSHYEKEVRNLLATDPEYHAIFEQSANTYLQKYCQRLGDLTHFDKERAYRLCMDYLVEECAALCMWPETNCQFELYPARHNDAVIETRKRFIYPQYPDLVQAITMRFRHAEELRPQSFELVH